MATTDDDGTAWIEPGDKKTIAVIGGIWFLATAYQSFPTASDPFNLAGMIIGGVIGAIIFGTLVVLGWKGLQKARMRLPL